LVEELKSMHLPQHQFLTSLTTAFEDALSALGEPASLGLRVWIFWLVYQLISSIGTVFQHAFQGWKYRQGLLKMCWIQRTMKGLSWAQWLQKVGKLYLEDGTCLVLDHERYKMSASDSKRL
jgi:hypothetical protein